MIRLRKTVLSRAVQATFHAPLTNSLVLARGSGSPTFTRATTATVADWEGRYNTAASGEARFHGARRVKNLMTNTQTFTPLAVASTAAFTAQNATDPLGGSNAGTLVFGASGRFFGDAMGVAYPTTYAFSVWVRSTALSTVLSVLFLKETGTDTARGSVQFTPSTTWQRIYVTGTTTAANCRIEIGNGGAAGQGTMQFYGPQLENIAGQTNAQSQEFQSVGLLSAPYQGLNVDGVGAYGYQPAQISVWGDSLCAIKLPNGVRSLYESVPTWVYDGGVGGDTSTQIRTRLVAASASQLANISVLWPGRNNYTVPATVKADLAAMIAALGHTRYVVLSILNGDYATEYAGQADYATIIQLNADLAALYPNNFLDVRNPLVALYDPTVAQDVIDHGRDVPPSSIRIDNIHLTPTGYNFVAAKIKAFIDVAGWSVSPTPLSSATMQGYLAEVARTNNCIWSRDFTNAAWVKSTMTAALDQPGLDGTINGASSLLATGANATVKQTITIAAVNRPFSVWMKRITGTGNIDLAQDGASYTTQTLTTAWQRFTLVASQLNPVLSIRVVTSGDKIAVDYAALEDTAGAAATFATTPIATTTVAVTRNADVLSYPAANNVVTGLGTVVASITATNSALIQTLVNVNDGAATNAIGLYVNNSTLAARGQVISGNVTQADIATDSGSIGVLQKETIYWNTNIAQVFNRNVVGTLDTSVTVPASLTTINVGCRPDSQFPTTSPIRDVKIFMRVLNDSQVITPIV